MNPEWDISAKTTSKHRRDTWSTWHFKYLTLICPKSSSSVERFVCGPFLPRPPELVPHRLHSDRRDQAQSLASSPDDDVHYNHTTARGYTPRYNFRNGDGVIFLNIMIWTHGFLYWIWGMLKNTNFLQYTKGTRVRENGTSVLTQSDKCVWERIHF